MKKVPGPELSAADLQAILRLRAEVFIVEQKAAYLDVDGRDLERGTIHYWFEDVDGVLAYLRVLTEPHGDMRIGRVCAAQRARGGGLAYQLMAAAVEDLSAVRSVLDSQVYARGFYERFGYVAEGDEYVDEDGIPHVTMRRLARTG
ncbi:ElaA protein [Kibdelosporangium banguiense]|uniref:ElaA protein n=1 Tax=Kibdelosporangium banguiense TaxID=1365924 RepID=A0ABS4THG1_9PSEU|nr:ElaA protein [Kibdelosporangium banguiense]